MYNMVRCWNCAECPPRERGPYVWMEGLTWANRTFFGSHI